MPDDNGDNGNGSAESYDETISGIHRVYADGSIFRLLSSGEWEEVTEPMALRSKLTLKGDDDLEREAKRTVLRAFIDLMSGKQTPAILIVFSALSLLLGGAGGFGGYQMFGGDRVEDHDEMASKAQVKELTAALVEATERVAKLEAALESHKATEAHPGALKRIAAVETDVAIANKLIEVHHE